MSRIVAAVLVLGLSCGFCFGEEQSEQVQAVVSKALDAYKEGRTQEAISQLQQAIAIMQQSQQTGMASFFPKPPDGFEAGQVDSQSATFGSGKQAGSYTHVSRVYTRKSDDLTVTVSLTDSPELIQAQKMVAEQFKNPSAVAAMNQNPDVVIKTLQGDGWFGWMTVNKKSDAQVTAFCNGCVLSINVNKPDQQVVEIFWQGINLKGLAAAHPAKPEKSDESKE
jgi:hypothetical protein